MGSSCIIQGVELSVLCWPRCVGWGGGRKAQREGMDGYTQLIHVVVQKKWTQHCKVTMCVCAQTCLSLCDPMDCSPQGSSVHGIFQERIAEWIIISYSRESSWPRNWTCVLCISCMGSQILCHWEAHSHRQKKKKERNLKVEPLSVNHLLLPLCFLVLNGSFQQLSWSLTCLFLV